MSRNGLWSSLETPVPPDFIEERIHHTAEKIVIRSVVAHYKQKALTEEWGYGESMQYANIMGRSMEVFSPCGVDLEGVQTTNREDGPTLIDKIHF